MGEGRAIWRERERVSDVEREKERGERWRDDGESEIEERGRRGVRKKERGSEREREERYKERARERGRMRDREKEWERARER